MSASGLGSIGLAGTVSSTDTTFLVSGLRSYIGLAEESPSKVTTATSTELKVGNRSAGSTEGSKG